MADLTDLKRAIEEHALKRTDDGHRIIAEISGEISHQPWLFDFRSLFLQSRWLDRYAEIFWETYGDRYPFQVGGLETSALPLIAAILMKGVQHGKPVNGFFIRKSRKRSGLMRQIEGVLTDDPVILVDDLINSGSSFKKQIAILRDAGMTVSRIYAVIRFRAREAYTFTEETGPAVDTLFTLEDFGIPLQESVPAAEHDPFDVIWRFGTGSPSFEHVVPKSAPVLDEERVYFGSDDGKFYAVDQETGRIAWTYAIEKHPRGKGIFSTPVIAKDRIFFGGYDGTVYALAQADGTVAWTYADADWIGSSPAVAPSLGSVFIGLEFGLFRKRGGIAALDIQTGDEKWRDVHIEMTHASPLFIQNENLVLIGSNDGTIHAYDAASGAKRWHYRTGADVKMRAAYDPVRQLALVPSMDSKLYALSTRDGAPQWAFLTGAGVYSNPLVAGDVVYVASLDKTLYAINLDTGRELWKFETRGRIFASPTIIDDSLFVGSNDGCLYELAPESGTLRSKFQASERIVNAIAYNPTTKRFFVPTVANELYCLTRKSSAPEQNSRA